MPEITEDQVALALNALRAKNYLRARECIALYAKNNKLDLQHYLIKGLAELALCEWQEAADTFSLAVEIYPHQAQLWANLGLAQENLGQLAEAAENLQRGLELNPQQPEAFGNLSNIYRKQGFFEIAEAMAHKAYEQGAPKAQALNSLGLAYVKQGKFEAAEKVYREALALEPENTDILSNLANLNVDQLQFDRAWPFFAAARTINDNAQLRRDEGMARLLAGDYKIGWQLYESRLELPKALRALPNCPRYQGEPLAGKKLLIIAEQGFGDAIQFSRYGALMSEAGADLVWLLPKPLARLMAANLPGQIVVEGEALPNADYYAPILSLPLLTQCYDFKDAPKPAAWQLPLEIPLPEKPNKKQRIGLVWAGSRTHERDRERSITLSAFAELLKKIPADYVAPFKSDALDDIGSLPIHRLDDQIEDFADTAALLKQLDCLITVDTAVAHLAGMLGVKTFLLLPHCPDWRWGVTGETTPWYPALTLLRQPVYGDWDSVITSLVDLLKIENTKS
jgi:Flp pilus assembly protein TadD